jgi:hypothetical protein
MLSTMLFGSFNTFYKNTEVFIKKEKLALPIDVLYIVNLQRDVSCPVDSSECSLLTPAVTDMLPNCVGIK